MNRPSNKQLYVWGHNNRDQHGFGDDAVVLMISNPRIKNVPGTTWTLVACGPFHTVALSSNGEVFTWGNGGSGRLGHGDRKNRNVPEKVEIPGGEAVVKVACGESHTAAVTATGTLFTWYVRNCNNFFIDHMNIG